MKNREIFHRENFGETGVIGAFFSPQNRLTQFAPSRFLLILSFITQ